jgi:hypothetical protein
VQTRVTSAHHQRDGNKEKRWSFLRVHSSDTNSFYFLFILVSYGCKYLLQRESADTGWWRRMRLASAFITVSRQAKPNTRVIVRMSLKMLTCTVKQEALGRTVPIWRHSPLAASGRNITLSLDDRYKYTRGWERKTAKRQHIRRDNPVLPCILSDVKLLRLGCRSSACG